MDRTEPVELTNMCMVYSDDLILMQNRTKNSWKGLVFPGGHVEKNESVTASVIREVREETGLVIREPRLCGIKEFKGNNGRYLVFFYKTDKFEGVLQDSPEGETMWVRRENLKDCQLVDDFMEMLEVFDRDDLSEFLYDEDWNIHLL